MTTLKIPVDKNYRRSLVRTVEILHVFHNQLLGQAVNLSTIDEFSELRRKLDKNSDLNFKYEDLTDISDANVQHLIELIELIKEKMKVFVDDTLQLK